MTLSNYATSRNDKKCCLQFVILSGVTVSVAYLFFIYRPAYFDGCLHITSTVKCAINMKKCTFKTARRLHIDKYRKSPCSSLNTINLTAELIIFGMSTVVFRPIIISMLLVMVVVASSPCLHLVAEYK